MLLPILSTLIFIIAFIFFYKKYKTEEEELLILKLIGYYLLGGFRFNFNNFSLPAGFIIFAAFLRPRTNKTVKKAIACLGLFAFFCGVLTPYIEKAYFERERFVNASSNNIYTMDLNIDFNSIRQMLEITGYVKIEDFQADFDKLGSISRLSFTFLANDSNGIVLYRVNYNTNKNKYTIMPTKVKEWLQYNRLIGEEQFLTGLKYLDLKKAIPEKDYPYYTVRCDGSYSGWEVKDFDNYLVTDKGIKQLKDEELPVEGYVFWVYGNKGTDEGDHISFSSEDNRAYILSVVK